MPDTVIVYTPAELPAALRQALPPASAVATRLFFVARPGPSVVRELMAAVPEPDLSESDRGDVAAGMALSGRLLRLLASAVRLGDRLGMSAEQQAANPDGRFNAGFHCGDPDQIRAFLSQRATVLPLSQVLDGATVLDVADPTAAPQPILLDETGRPTLASSPGLFSMPSPSFPLTVHGLGGRATVNAAPGQWLHPVALQPPALPFEPTQAPLDAQQAGLLIAHIFGPPVTWTVEETRCHLGLCRLGHRPTEGTDFAMVILRNGAFDSLSTATIELPSGISGLRWLAALNAARQSSEQGRLQEPTVHALLDLGALSN